jgi:hypothetical protein
MKLQEIKNKLSSLPVIMDISDELVIINDLMAVEPIDLIGGVDTFKSIINSLELSHTDSGFMELTKENEHIFINFYCWLKEVNSEFNLKLNNNIIDSFSLTVKDVKKLMS